MRIRITVSQSAGAGPASPTRMTTRASAGTTTNGAGICSTTRPSRGSPRGSSTNSRSAPGRHLAATRPRSRGSGPRPTAPRPDAVSRESTVFCSGHADRKRPRNRSITSIPQSSRRSRRPSSIPAWRPGHRGARRSAARAANVQPRAGSSWSILRGISGTRVANRAFAPLRSCEHPHESARNPEAVAGDVPTLSG